MPAVLACLTSTVVSDGMQSYTSSGVASIADGQLLGSSFSYSSLQDGQIRLLRLLPGSSEIDVICELFQLPWLSKPDSTTIAGMWFFVHGWIGSSAT
jgi:hypothetical protein